MLALELHQTHQQLTRNLGPGEMAYWRAVFELRAEQYEQARQDAERNAKHGI